MGSGGLRRCSLVAVSEGLDTNYLFYSGKVVRVRLVAVKWHKKLLDLLDYRYKTFEGKHVENISTHCSQTVFGLGLNVF